MEIKDFSQAMALQKKLSAKLVTNVEKFRSKKAAPVAQTIKEQERLIANAKAEVATSEKEKALVIKRWDQRLQQRKSTVQRLEKGLKEIKKRVTEQEKAVKKTAPAPKPKKKLVTKPKVKRIVTKKKR